MQTQNRKIAIIIAPNWGDYAKKFLPELMQSSRRQDYTGEIKYFITDNETTPESVAMLQRIIPGADIVLNKNNDGFAKGVNDSLRQAMLIGFDYYIVVNIDSVMEKSFISNLIKAAETDKRIGIVQGRVMLNDDKNKINSIGNATHFLGFGYALGYKEEWDKVKDKNSRIKKIHYPSGVSILFTHELLTKIGLFDEEYWMYNEDQEIGWRTWLAGFKCVLAPDAVIYHKYEFARSIKQYYWMDRNRIISILICYKLLTLVLILPAFILMELGHVLFSLKSGWFNEKIRVWKYFLKLDTWLYLLKARKRNQKLRQVNDSDIAKLISGKIWYQEIDDWKLRVINPIFNLYWKICKFIIIW